MSRLSHRCALQLRMCVFSPGELLVILVSQNSVWNVCLLTWAVNFTSLYRSAFWDPASSIVMYFEEETKYINMPVHQLLMLSISHIGLQISQLQLNAICIFHPFVVVFVEVFEKRNL